MKQTHAAARNFVMLMLLCVPLLLSTPAKAHAYVDPGSGSFIYQAIYAAFLGGTYYFRKLLDRVWKKRR